MYLGSILWFWGIFPHKEEEWVLGKSILCWCQFLVRFKSTVKWWWYLKILYLSLLIFVLLVVLFCTFTIFSMKEIVNVSEREGFWGRSEIKVKPGFTKLESSCSLLKVSEIGFKNPSIWLKKLCLFLIKLNWFNTAHKNGDFPNK